MSKIVRIFAKNLYDMNMKDNEKKVILFVRCSTEQQDISSQISDLKTFARSLGFTNESEYYIIGGIAASAVKLNELYLSYISELKQMISDNKCKCVLVFALNRLFRNELVGAELKDFFINTKTQLFVREPSLKLLDDNGNIDVGMSIAFSIFSTMASLEAKEIIEKTKRGREYAKSLGKYYGGKLPFGYTSDKDKNVILDKEQAKIVKDIYLMYSTGKYSTSTIKKEYADRGIELKSKLVNRILVNTEYYNNKFGLNIIDKALFDKCLEVRKANFSSSKKTFKYKTLLNRLIKCKCGYGYTSIHNTLYVCNQKAKFKVNSFEHSINLPLSLFDGMIVDICNVQTSLNYLQDLEQFRKETNERINIINLKINNLELKLSNYHERKDKIVELYIDGTINKEAYTQKLNKLDLNNENILKELDLLNHEKKQLLEVLEAKNKIRIINNEDDYYLNIRQHIKAIYVGDVVDNYCIITIEFLKGNTAELKFFPKEKCFTDLHDNPLEFSKRVLNVEEMKFTTAKEGIGKENAIEFCYLLGKTNKLKKLLSEN
ncbi:MAG: recombinase family protein [Bacteroidales bacterium]|nr:recombinase family protein [Bacteroidales bacterium]